MAIAGYADLFPAGLGFDITGAYLLAKGLGMRPEQYTRRFRASGNTFARVNVRAAEDFADSKAGVRALVAGFVLQAAGYVLSVGGVVSHTRGPAAAFIAFLWAAGAIGTAYSLASRGRWHTVRAWLVECAHWDLRQEQRRDAPDAQELWRYAYILDLRLPDEHPDADGLRQQARRLWRVDRIWIPELRRVVDT